jgi:hypothetical protein
VFEGAPPQAYKPRRSRALTYALGKALSRYAEADLRGRGALADVRAQETRARDTWQHVERELNKAAADGDTAQVSITLQMVPQQERVEHRVSERQRHRSCGPVFLGVFARRQGELRSNFSAILISE